MNFVGNNEESESWGLYEFASIGICMQVKYIIWRGVWNLKVVEFFTDSSGGMENASNGI